ncbi:hypothetical protein KIN20_025705 [Parelaphostrongylus tenuis]|uniref:Uncharacterized protein n=1 Tax=Parelaphostrongylus tenuis TaxID=148309 RepID=A0AAD5NDG1_PARTN|nr:hypothetical protein KIN20_025705 [Parelaphostrongylus tenuis]
MEVDLRQEGPAEDSSMAKLHNVLSVKTLLATMSKVFGCGVMPVSQMSTRNFDVTDFTLSSTMVYSNSAVVQARVPGVAPSEAVAKGM